ncbi:MAG TPA: proteasome subunit alpha [Acidimicrobiales bacterium]|nr:proteasome subunit alpha [Acidimicrobiales bacterium]
MPYYVSPEQVMADRADYARKGISRGRSLVAVVTDEGIVLCAENPSSTLHKINEIYDRIAFGGVGKFNEFDQLRVAGVRHADLKGFEFSRSDVDARSLANQYAQHLGQVFTHEMKPLEVELLVAEVGPRPDDDRLFHLLYDGTMRDESDWCALGGDTDAVSKRLEGLWRPNLDFANGLAVAVAALSRGDEHLGADELEVAGLARNGRRRAFERWDEGRSREVLASVTIPAVDASADGTSGGTAGSANPPDTAAPDGG